MGTKFYGLLHNRLHTQNIKQVLNVGFHVDIIHSFAKLQTDRDIK